MIYKVIFQKPPLERQIIDCDVTFPFDRQVIACDVLDLGEVRFIVCDVHDLISRQSMSVRNVIEVTSFTVDTIAEMAAGVLCDSVLIFSPAAFAELQKYASAQSKMLLSSKDTNAEITYIVGSDGNTLLISNQDISPWLNSKIGHIQESISIFSGTPHTEIAHAIHPLPEVFHLGCSDINTSILKYAHPDQSMVDVNAIARIRGNVRASLEPIDLQIDQSSFKLSYSLFADALEPISICIDSNAPNIGMNWAIRVQNELQLQSSFSSAGLRVSEHINSTMVIDPKAEIREQWFGISLDEVRMEVETNTIDTELYRLRKLFEMDDFTLDDFDDMTLHQIDYVKIELEP